MSKLTLVSRLWSVAFAGALLPAFEGARTEADPGVGRIVVRIDHFRNDRGIARVAAFDQPAGFPGTPEQALRRATSKLVHGKAEVQFESLPYGIYAVAVHHDENADGKLNKGLSGRPKDGYGVSNKVID